MNRASRSVALAAAALTMMANGVPALMPEPPRIVRRFIGGSYPVSGVGKVRFNRRRRERRRRELFRFAGTPTQNGWQHPAFQEAVNRLTNYERSRWAAKGYPGLRTKDVGELVTLFPQTFADDPRSTAHWAWRAMVR